MNTKILVAYALTATAVSAFLTQPANAQKGGGGGAVTASSNRNPAGLTSASDRDAQGKTANTKEQKAPWVTPPPGNLDGLKLEGRKEIKLEVSTDANGKVSKVNVAKSTGNAEVDKRVVSWVMSKWSGPKSSKATIPGYVGQ